LDAGWWSWSSLGQIGKHFSNALLLILLTIFYWPFCVVEPSLHTRFVLNNSQQVVKNWIAFLLLSQQKSYVKLLTLMGET